MRNKWEATEQWLRNKWEILKIQMKESISQEISEKQEIDEKQARNGNSQEIWKTTEENEK